MSRRNWLTAHHPTSPGRSQSHRLSEGIGLVQAARVYDNSSARQPYRVVATYENGRVIGAVSYPDWSGWQGPNGL